MNASSSATALLPTFASKTRKRRLLRPLLVVVALAAAGTIGWQVVARVAAPAEAPNFATAPIARADVVVKVTATGTLSPVVTVDVGSQISGRIAELHADYNSQVKAGQILAVIEPDQLESSLREAKARLSSAYADHARAKAQAAAASSSYKRASALSAAGAVSKAEVEAALASKRTADASVRSAVASITVAKAAVAKAQSNLDYTVIKSPIDGVVVSRSVDVGQTVAASLSAPTLFVIAEDLRKMEVHTSVAESDIGRLADGMAVEFSVDAFPEETFTGTVKQVRYEATTVSGVVTYDAVVAVANEELKLRPGMTANASFVVAEARDVLTIPSKALTYRPAGANRQRRARGASQRSGQRAAGQRRARGNNRRIFVLRDGVPTPIRVAVGLTDGAITAVTSDELVEGDLAITGGDSGAATTRSASRAGQGQRRGRRRGPPSVL